MDSAADKIYEHPIRGVIIALLTIVTILILEIFHK